MGDRVSIQFANEDMEWGDKSVVLFHHWGGRKFVDFATAWAFEFKRDMKKFAKSKGNDPTTRLEPNNVMLQFIKAMSIYKHSDAFKYSYFEDGEHKYKEELMCYSIYLGKDENDGDNSDNGNHVIELSDD